MTDLDIIKQIERQIGKKLKKLEKVYLDSVGYVINAQNQITELGLSKCDIERIPEGLTELIYLQKLFIIANEIVELPDSFGQLQNLISLRLDNNQLQGLPVSFGQLKNLRELHLGINQLQNLPTCFWELENLQQAYLNSNAIKQLPKEILDLNLEILWTTDGIEKGIAVGDNPLISPTPEIIQQGQQAIIDYFASLETETQLRLNEAKILILGQGGVGKTSLVNRLLHNTFDEQENKTEGINVEQWQLKIEQQNIRLNVWDFGGQEIMHATHQFFLNHGLI